MIDVLRGWYDRHFSDPQAVILAILLAVGFSVVLIMGEVLTPVIAAIVIAYVLEGLVKKLQTFKVPHLISVTSVVTFFVISLLIIFLVLVPLLSTVKSVLYRVA